MESTSEPNPEYASLDNTLVENFLNVLNDTISVNPENSKQNGDWKLIHEPKKDENYWVWQKKGATSTNLILKMIHYFDGISADVAFECL